MRSFKCKCGKDIELDDEDFSLVIGKSSHIYCSGSRLQIQVKHERSKEHYLISLSSFIKHSYSTLYDHRDHNPHNMQKSNLRACSHAQNCQNRRLRKDNKSGFKGVSLMPGTRELPWQMCIKANGRKIQKYFKTAFEAAWEYNRLAIELHGEFACLNDLTKQPEFIGPTLS